MKINEKLNLICKYNVQIERAGKIVADFEIKNRVPDAGANKLLGMGFHADAQITAWYIGLVDYGSFSAFADADTMASHPGWAEFTGYTSATRVAWGPAASAARAITNTTLAVFVINADGTLKGIFVSSDSTKTGATGTLWSEGAFVSNQPVLIGDLVRVTYTVSIAA